MFKYKSGVLKFIIDSAEIYRNTEVVGEMDPFVTIFYKSLNENETKLKTTVVQEGGKNPKWKD
jgi:Ca2+-dependent lipid-binding protein